MKSQNYTYEVKEVEIYDGYIVSQWFIIGLDGKQIAVAHSENNAILIVCALNGVA